MQPWTPSGWVGFSRWAILSADSVGLSRLLSQSASKTTFFAPKTAYLGAKLGVLAGRVSPTGFWAGWADRANPDRRARNRSQQQFALEKTEKDVRGKELMPLDQNDLRCSILTLSTLLSALHAVLLLIARYRDGRPE